jgi:hypothetical protein
MGAYPHAAGGMSTSRFDKLERPREERKDDASEQSTPGLSVGRFTPVDTAPTREESAERSLERFTADGTQGLRTQRRADEEQPFVRCPVCERDWGRFDTRCGQCGEALDSEKAKAFNAALWAKRLEERRAEAEGAAQREAAAAKQQAELDDAKKAMAIGLAQQVKHRYEAEHAAERLDDDRRRAWRMGRGIGTTPFLLFGAFRSHGPMRWVFLGVALLFAAVDVWLWWRQDPD